MSSIKTAISALGDEAAIQLLNRFVRSAVPSPSASADLVEAQLLERARSMAVSLSLHSAGEHSAVSAGALARAALSVLAADPQFSAGIAALLANGGLASFAESEPKLDVATVLDVLEVSALASAAQRSGPNPSESNSPLQSTRVRALAEQLVAFAGWQHATPKSDAEYRVWYATSRRPLESGNPESGFGVERDDCIHYGTCRVFVPRSHKIGSVGSPWWKRALTLSDDRLKLLAIQRTTEADFWAGVRGHLASCSETDRTAVVFVHGFNVDFEEAALRAAQLGFDLQIRGAMAFYSWASRGDVKMYPADEAAVDLDEDPIADFLCGFAKQTGARQVHIIAHSMGNRAVLRAVDRIANDAQRRSGVKFGQIVLAAADVDARKFQQLCGAYGTLAERTTLYVSSRDRAVEASAWLHDFPRAGLMPPVTVAAGIDTINAVNADVTLLGHGYVAEAREVVGDIHALLHNGVAPPRFGLTSAKTDQGQQYWLIGA